ncbi:hypothetical protein OIU79_002412 [Salix purpurea]|uniref:Uncharacterized protein n=1 Tax=Salix purpurea TaxID=77065 RepID=A0A9Q0UT21_SALPP|nr:hypothetical protein OIU79_002412 [Salix purpurea]
MQQSSSKWEVKISCLFVQSTTRHRKAFVKGSLLKDLSMKGSGTENSRGNATIIFEVGSEDFVSFLPIHDKLTGISNAIKKISNTIAFSISRKQEREKPAMDVSLRNVGLDPAIIDVLVHDLLEESSRPATLPQERFYVKQEPWLR